MFKCILYFNPLSIGTELNYNQSKELGEQQIGHKGIESDYSAIM